MTRTSATSLVAAWVSAALVCTTSLAADDLPEGFGEKPDSRFVVSDDPYYKDPQIAMKNLVAAYRKNHRTNRFCVVGYQWKSENVHVLVLWQEEDRLLLWGGALDPDSRARSLIGVNRSLKLGKDTVKTENDINGSTYLETEQWWHAVADDCMKHGEKYVIEPFEVDYLPEGFSTPGRGRKPDSRFVASGDPSYKNPQIALRTLVAERQKNDRTNRFCVVGYEWQGGYQNVWVLWKEEERLLLWDRAFDDCNRSSSLIGGRRDLKIGKDTVKTEEDIDGSTDLVTEQWWYAVAYDCMKHGEKYVIKPFKAAKPPAD